jgi:putative Holliday junction resolvase
VRILALDVGERRIGVASADDSTRVAVPLTTLAVEGDPIDSLVNLIEEEGADRLVVGMPLSLSGAMGPQAERVEALVEALTARLDVPVDTFDERLSTVEAGHRQTPRKGRKAGRRKPPSSGLDAMAATIILQTYLDRERSRG